MKNPTKILITGGAGYIGSHTLLALKAQGYEPVVVDNFSNSNPATIKALQSLVGRFSFYELNCCDPAAMRRVFNWEPDIEGVIHFAAHKSVAESVHHPLKYYYNNLESLRILLAEMRSHGLSKLVFSSSAAVYGQSKALPVKEDTPQGVPSSPYGASKQIGEQMISDVAHAYPELKVAMLRYFNPVGAHESARIGEQLEQQAQNLVPVLTQAAAGLRDPLTIYGRDYDTPDGTCLRDYIHVMDLAEAHVAACFFLEAQIGPFCEPINIGTGQGTSVKELIETFEVVTGTTVPHRYGERRAGDIPALWAETSKAQRLLGWRAKRTAADALRDAWAWQERCIDQLTSPLEQVV